MKQIDEINLNDNDRQAVLAAAKILRETFPVDRVVLYGSKARGHMGFYNLNPDKIRDLQSPDAGDILARDGANLTSILRRIQIHSPTTKQRIEE